MEKVNFLLHIQISIGTKFLLKLRIMVFWTKFTPKRVFLVENRKNITIEFCMVELVWKPNFSLD